MQYIRSRFLFVVICVKFFFLFSCATRPINVNKMTGIYEYRIGKNQDKISLSSIELKSDHTFTYRHGNFETRVGCEGNWSASTQNEILLNCQGDTSVLSQLSRGYDFDRNKVVKVLSNDKIKLGKVVFRLKSDTPR